jgi:lipopolysaccharide export system permease protein
MRLIDRYILRNYILSVTYCLLAFCMVFVINDLFAHLAKFIESKATATLLLRYYIFVVALTLEYLLPASLLLATLYTLWQFTRSNELTAMRASGVSFHRIMLPFLGVGLFCSVVTVGIKEAFSPRASVWAQQFSDSGYRETDTAGPQEKAFYNSREHRMWLIERFDVRRPSRLEDVKITQERPDGTRVEEVTAALAECLDGTWWFHDPAIQRYDARDNPVGPPVRAPGPKPVIEMPSLTETPSDLVLNFKDWEFLSSFEMYRYIKSHTSLSRARRHQLQFDLHLRLAMPWACLVVTLFGIPTGARSGRQSALTGIFFSLAFFFGFYALMQIGMFMAKRQVIEPWLGAWLSNIVFGAAGVFMALRTR